MNVKKLALGTVQFGLHYGINNNNGQVNSNEIGEIIELCRSLNIDLLDTAYAYGESELNLGKCNIQDFKIVSKSNSNIPSIFNTRFFESIQRLGVESVYAYLLHNFALYNSNESIWKELQRLKKNRKVKKIGISLYSPHELETLWSDGVELDIVQIPYNVFDQSFESYFKEMKARRIEIHVRSTFLQGLFFRSPNSLPIHFDSIKDKLKLFTRWNKYNNYSIAETCLFFTLANPLIDKVVIGVDSLNQLLDNVKLVQNIDFDERSLGDLKEFRVVDESIINPSLWKL